MDPKEIVKILRIGSIQLGIGIFWRAHFESDIEPPDSVRNIDG